MATATHGKWEDITDMLTEKGRAELKVGQVLIFDYEGSRTNLKIVRKSRTKVWAKEIELFDRDEFEVVDAQLTGNE